MKQPLKEIDALLDRIYPKHFQMKNEIFFMKGVTPPQARVLFLLYNQGPLSISEIARELSTPDSNISNICSRLEKKGLVSRHRQKDDQRVVEIHLTEKAKPQIQKSREKFDRSFENAGTSITAKDIDGIIIGLEKLDVFLDIMIDIMNEEKREAGLKEPI